MRTNPTYLTRTELADRWRCKQHTIENWAHRGIGPPYRLLGGRALYELTDIEAYERARLVDPITRSAA
jgi:hypothetical protein